MQQLLIDTLQQQIENLRKQLSQIEAQAEDIRDILAQLETKLAELPEPAPEEEEQPEVEVEFYVDDSIADDDQLLSEEEQQVENTVEDMLVEEIERDAVVEPEAEPAPADIAEPTPADTAEHAPATENREMPKGVTLPHVDDIRKAISLGDRFLFQRELFGGDGEKMNKTIDVLNNLHSLDEAMEFIAKKFNWDTESQAYELFANILKRRY